MREKLSSYEIIGPLRSGAAGIIYKAYDSRLDRLVAIEVLSSRDGITSELRSRILARARVWSALNHPNITMVHDIGEDAEDAYIVMELPDGPALDELMAGAPPTSGPERSRNRSMDLEQAISLWMQLSSAVHHAHQRGIVHGDIRPSSILVCADGTAKIGDFGLSGPLCPVTSAAHAPAITEYSSPEQRDGHADERADQYSLAAIFRTILAAATGGRSRHEALAESQLRAILARATNKDPAKRYPDLLAMRSELAEVLVDLVAAGDRHVLANPVAAGVSTVPHALHPLPADEYAGVYPRGDLGGWVHANRMTAALTGVAALTLVVALWSPSPQRTTFTPAAPVSSAQPSASTSTPAATASTVDRRLDPTGRDAAESARDHALAARYASAKAEAIDHAPDLHLAAQRKEIEADAAMNKSDYSTAYTLYNMARDGYRMAAQRAELQVAAVEKAEIDAQLAADARARIESHAAQTPAQAGAGQAAVRWSVPVVYGSDQPAHLPPKIIEAPVDRSFGKPSQPLAAYAAVFAEKTDGHRSGGTWGACWRSDPASARECAKASCEASRKSGQPCIQVAQSKPGQHCAVAKASGFGVTWAACSTGRAEAEALAVDGCREAMSESYGSVPAPCQVAWSTVH